MDVAIIVAIVAAFEALGVAVINGLITKSNKENEAYRARREKSEEDRKERDEAVYNLVLANAVGTEVLLHKAHGEQLNGNVEDALNSIHDAKAEYNRICNKQMAHL